MHDLPGPLRLTSTFPFVGRSAELETLRSLMPQAQGEGRRVALLGGEPGSGKSRLVREFAAEAADDGALVLYGACDAVVRIAVRAVRRGPRPPRPRSPSRSSCARRSGPAAASSPGCCPTCPPGWAISRRRSRPIRIPSATGCIRRSPTSSPGQPAAGRCCSCSRTGTGRTRRRCCSCATWRGPPATRACCCSPPSATPRPTCRRRCPRRSPTCAAPTTSSGCGSPGSPTARRSPSSSAAPPGGELERRGLPELAARDQRPHRGQRVPGLRALARARRDRGGRGRRRDDPADPRRWPSSATPESVREVVSQRLSRLAPRTTDLLELAATAGAEFELEPVRRAAGLDEAELLAALDEAVRSGMIEELPSPRLAYRFTHELVRRALYDRLTGVRRAELHLRVGEALEGGDGRSGTRARRPRPPLRRRRPVRRTGARRSSTTLRAARAATGALAFDEAAARLRTALELPHRGSARAGRGLPRARDRQATGRQGARRAGGLRVGGRDRPRARRRRAARSGGDRLRGGLLAPGHRRPGRGGAARGGGRGARRRRARSCASACSAGWPGRSTSRAITSAGRSSARAPSRWPGSCDDRAGLATVLMRSYWSRGARARSRRSSRC